MSKTVWELGYIVSICSIISLCPTSAEASPQHGLLYTAELLFFLFCTQYSEDLSQEYDRGCQHCC